MSDGPASWGVDHVIVKFKSEYLTFRVNQTIEQTREVRQEHLSNRRYNATLQMYAESKPGKNIISVIDATTPLCRCMLSQNLVRAFRSKFQNSIGWNFRWTLIWVGWNPMVENFEFFWPYSLPQSSWDFDPEAHPKLKKFWIIRNFHLDKFFENLIICWMFLRINK